MRRKPRFRVLGLSLSLVLAVSTTVAMGQVVVVGELGGQVKDETGAALPGANVAATATERGFTRNTTTDSVGKFRFSEIQPGRYNITVTLSGFGHGQSRREQQEDRRPGHHEALVGESRGDRHGRSADRGQDEYRP